jgi:Icc-related predicted phosphoesterase
LGQWFFTSDLHGQGSLYEQVLALAATRTPEVVILGGDLAPHEAGDEGIARQRVFYEGFLVEFARRLVEAAPGADLLLMMGNDDWAGNLPCLERHDGTLWKVIHGRSIEVRGHPVAGMSWVPITPFGIKDWERWDDGGEERPARLDGVTSWSGRVEPVRFDPARRTPTIAQALDELSALGPADRTLFILHSPPRDTHCDRIASGAHVGSRAIRAFVERWQPPLVLSGHIHEAPRLSSSYRDTLGRTVVVNPGQFGTSRLCGVWFDPASPGATLAHSVYG